MFLSDNIKVFSGSSNPELAAKICKYLGVPAGGAKIERFPDGEKIIKCEDDVRGKDCFIV
jgi:ribose-phosphate pyrophosphokinase